MLSGCAVRNSWPRRKRAPGEEALAMNRDEASMTALLGRLRDKASRKMTVYYYEIADVAGLSVDDPFFDIRIGEKLDEVNRFEHAQGRPLLSAIVISKESGRPGEGFFTCAQELGVYAGEDRDQFWAIQLKRVHDRWRQEPPGRNRYALGKRS
jgi:hypothetical protein